jgi:hypothetical protein
MFISELAPYISSDLGETWNYVPTDYTHFYGLFTVVGDLHSNLYAVSDYPVLENMTVRRSVDDGLTWSMFDDGLDRSQGNNIAGLIETPDGTVFAYTSSGIYKHGVDDCSWTSFSEGLPAKEINCMTYDRNGRLYAGSDGNGIFKSTQTFNKIPKLIGHPLLSKLDFDTVELKTNTCQNTTIKNIGLAPFILKSFTVTDPVPFSVADESAKKLPIVLNPKDSITMTICFHPPQPAHYASSIIWNTDIDASLCTGIPSESFLEGIAVEKSLVDAGPKENFSIQPNPIHSQAEIHFSTISSNHVKIECFDMLGRSGMILTDMNYGAGENSVVWDASNLPDGAYIVQFTIGSIHTSQSVIVVH